MKQWLTISYRRQYKQCSIELLGVSKDIVEMVLRTITTDKEIKDIYIKPKT